MELTILGGCGGWPGAGQACSGYLVETAGFRLLIDPGHGVLPRLLDRMPASAVDAVLVSHSHPDHCIDLNALLRARAFGATRCDPLPVYAPDRALDRVLAVDPMRTVAKAAEVHTLTDGSDTEIGPLSITAALLPHHVRNLGFRISWQDVILAYTGDSGPCPERAVLAKDADLLLAEASYPDEVPAADAGYLSTAIQAAELGAEAAVELTVLTHLLPGQSADDARRKAASVDTGREVGLAEPGMIIDLAGSQPLGRRTAGYSAGSAQGAPRRAALPE
ncbi:MAG: MBL fold metallo-hydrolase [Propionibacteriaceae bacterium]